MGLRVEPSFLALNGVIFFHMLLCTSECPKTGLPTCTQRTPNEFYKNIIVEHHKPARIQAMIYLRDIIKTWAHYGEFLIRLLQPQDSVVGYDSFQFNEQV